MSAGIHNMKPRKRYDPSLWKKQGLKHNWQKTSRKVEEGIIHFFACTACKPAHMKACDFESFGLKFR